MIARTALVVAAIVALAEPAHATCTKPVSGTPVRVPLAPADLGMLPEACEGTEASLEGRAAALVAERDLYGNVRAGLTFRGRAEVAERTWVALWVPGFDFHFVANATVESSRAGLGAGSVSLHHRLPLSGRLSLAPFVRPML